MKTTRNIFIIAALLLGLALPSAALADGVGGLWRADNGDKMEVQPDPQKLIITVVRQYGQRAKFGGWWTTPGRAFQFRVQGQGLVSCVLDEGDPNIMRMESRHGPSIWHRMETPPPPPPPPGPEGATPAGLWKSNNGNKIDIWTDPQKLVITVVGPGGQRAKFGGWWTTPGRAFQFRVKGQGLVSCVMDGGNPDAMIVETRHGREIWQRMPR